LQQSCRLQVHTLCSSEAATTRRILLIAQNKLWQTACRSLMRLHRRISTRLGGCLAFDLPTAAAFHLTRSVESDLRKYHALICKPSPNAGKRPEMATCINELRKANEDSQTAGHLRSLSGLASQHYYAPETFLENPEALGLFDIAKSGINAMADRVKQLPGTEEVPTVVTSPMPEPSLGVADAS
jgi:hypothetical protein